jgi:hypothetical protein
MTAPSLPASVWPTFRTLVLCVVPSAEGLDEGGWTAVQRIVGTALAQRPGTVRRQIALFLRLVSLLAFLRHGRRFTDLPLEKARRFLRGLERSPVLMVRRGFWGVRTLALMGYYARPEARAALGYQASGGGWRDRGGQQGRWVDRGSTGQPEAGVLTVDGTEAAGA